jgi:hypothetical protein
MAGCLLVSNVASAGGAWVELCAVSATGVVCYLGALALFDRESMSEIAALVTGRRGSRRAARSGRHPVEVAAAGDSG